ncbi:MAG: hypothetical protein K6G50_03830 [bacterium]|nr:hypothetical protein [bacterium]
MNSRMKKTGRKAQRSIIRTLVYKLLRMVFGANVSRFLTSEITPVIDEKVTEITGDEKEKAAIIKRRKRRENQK